MSSVQLQAATAAVPVPKDSGGGLQTSAIVGLCVAAFLAVLLAAGAYYVCVHRQCLSWSNKVNLPQANESLKKSCIYRGAYRSWCTMRRDAQDVERQ